MSKNGYLPKTGSFLVAESYSQQWPIFWLMYLFRFSINKCVSFVKKKILLIFINKYIDMLFYFGAFRDFLVKIYVFSKCVKKC